MALVYEDPEKVDAQQAAYGRYMDALEVWSESKIEGLHGEKLAEFIVDGVYNCGTSADLAMAEFYLGDLFAAIRAADRFGNLPQSVSLAWDKLRARVCIAQERARAHRQGY